MRLSQPALAALKTVLSVIVMQLIGYAYFGVSRQSNADTTAPRIRFEEIAGKAGIHVTLDNDAQGQCHQAELMVAGIAAFDYNQDGCTDLYFVNGAALPSLKKTGTRFHNRLFRNNCNLTFTDVTEQAGVAGDGYSMAVAAGDYDNDGNVDLFVAGVNRNTLYHNRGDGTFEDVTDKAGLTGVDPEWGKMWSISAGWLDYDHDGFLDLFVSNYVAWDPRNELGCGSSDNCLYCHPDNYRGLPNQLFRNNHDGTFSDVSRSSKVASSIGKGMGVAFGDYNGDGFTDVFVANDSTRNFLFENMGNGTFKEVGLAAGVAYGDHGMSVAGMGADFRDFDNDGLDDIVMSGMYNDTFLLFRNSGRPNFFSDYTTALGIAMASKESTGWGMGMYDFDNDGYKDLFFAASHFPGLKRLGINPPLANLLLRNIGGRRFEDVSKTAGPDFQTPALHHGAAFADFDNDGRVDVVVSVLHGEAKLFRNVTTSSGHWIALQLVGTHSNRQGLGARVRLSIPGATLYNHATTSVGYASSSESLVRFGLGQYDRATEIEVRWPGGRVQKLRNIQADRIVRIEEN